MSSSRSLEREILEIIAYRDPVDYHMVKRLVKERIGAVETDGFRAALENLQELELVRRELMHEYIHITNHGWEHLGGKTDRYESSVETEGAPVCQIGRAHV